MCTQQKINWLQAEADGIDLQFRSSEGGYSDSNRDRKELRSLLFTIPLMKTWSMESNKCK